MPPAKAIVARNRRANRDYEILETYEAGLALTGSEIKSIRLGKVDIQGAYGRIRNGEAWLLDCLHRSLPERRLHPPRGAPRPQAPAPPEGAAPHPQRPR